MPVIEGADIVTVTGSVVVKSSFAPTRSVSPDTSVAIAGRTFCWALTSSGPAGPIAMASRIPAPTSTCVNGRVSRVSTVIGPGPLMQPARANGIARSAATNVA
jgi:hypothetical protein